MDVLLSEAAPTLQHVIKHTIVNMHITKLLNVCERLLEELVKELLLANFTIVSASYEVRYGRKIRKRKAHLRRRKR